MRLEDFDFSLPEAQIAQMPPLQRGASRLLRLAPGAERPSHHAFSELPELLRAGDVLVLNDTRVVPARLLGQKAGTGGKVELLLVRPAAQLPASEALAGRADAEEWICLGQASKGLKAGTRVELGAGLRAEVVAALGEGEYRVRFGGGEDASSLEQLIARAGRLPLPPYISRPPSAEDAERYQTVFARVPGSVAAPTAGLHFTPELFARLEARGVTRATVTLEVGPGTFLPVRVENVEAHRMHLERFVVPEETARRIEQTRAAGGRVVAVGTTVVRTLEGASGEDGRLRAGPGETALFIRPGYRFRQVDALVTNFHLPRSTLLMLVSAFAGTERVKAAYAEAVAQGYRFFSYGDAMLCG